MFSMNIESIKVIGFDADDTLWINETFFREAEEKFCDLLESYMPRHDIMRDLFKVEIENLQLYGYGIKAFMLSMIETAMAITNHQCDPFIIQKIIDIGRNQLDMPIENLPYVEETLNHLQGKYKLVVVTKGDLLDQERKLEKSGLYPYFHHTEIVSEKTTKEYAKLFKHLDIKASEFLMIGNSLKSDILPILELGGYGIHIPFHTTWAHEMVDIEIQNPNFTSCQDMKEVISLLT
jgi:putative hydrolase of the HAD superfamily